LESETPAEPASPAVVQADAAGINGATDAGLTPPSAARPGSVIAAIPDDRLFTISEVSTLLKVPKSAVYSACDGGDLQYMKFEGAVQVEGRDLKAWLVSCHRSV
jgi:hypothetical protein